MAACCSVTMAVPRQGGRKEGWFRLGCHHAETQTAGTVFEIYPNSLKGTSEHYAKVVPVSVEIFTVAPALWPSKSCWRQYAHRCTLINCLRWTQLKQISASQWNWVNGAFQIFCNRDCGLHSAFVTITHTVHPWTPSHPLLGRKPGLWPPTRISWYQACRQGYHSQLSAAPLSQMLQL